MTCFGKVDNWFISRLEMPKLCGDLRCISMSECFILSWERLTGLNTDIKEISYKVVTPKWRGRE
jgi:hypothetical protein